MDTVDTRSASVPEDGEKIIEIQLERLRTFKNHPFKVRMDQERRRFSGLFVVSRSLLRELFSLTERI